MILQRAYLVFLTAAVLTGADPATPFGRNLLRNPGAEMTSETSNIPGWQDLEGFNEFGRRLDCLPRTIRSCPVRNAPDPVSVAGQAGGASGWKR
ncbi:hypothetical protein [Nevskia soli]|uniref:hypothetical protein n=1 Tax=Nevskia soli TaxID=418856 RepID=UPI0015D7FF77|nr:hypothetical protein [Nevskia soli]